MAMMKIRIVRVRMGQRFVLVRVRMGLPAIPGEVMRMLVMGIVRMQVLVFEPFMRVLVFVPFTDVQPNAERHQCACDPEADAGNLPQQQE
jgi:hypothetical protein